MDSLNDDVLDLIAEAAAAAKSIEPLSLTSRKIRLHCLPLLFEECTLRNYVPIVPTVFVPQPVRPYIRTLHFEDSCEDIPDDEWLRDVLRRDLQHAKDPLLCGVYSTSFFADGLKDMLRLRAVSFRLWTDQIHGIPWSVIRSLLSLPTLRDLAIDGHRLAPKLLQQEDLVLDNPAPLTSFRHTLYDYRWFRDRACPSEQHALLLILRKTHATMERLTLVAELSPLDEICTALEWPNLRELRLRGERRTIGDPPLPLVSMFANMPRLQILELKLAQLVGIDPQPFWPPGHVAEWRWPDLRHLTLSCPQVDDQIYNALPPTLESLALRYTPHRMNVVWNREYNVHLDGVKWQWPVLGSSDMLRILRRCRCSRLSMLQLEYCEDEADEELMDYIGAAFPTLTTLKLIRYRASYFHATPLDPLLRTVKTLTRLHTVHLHLDLPDTIRPGFRMNGDGSTEYLYDESLSMFFAATLKWLAGTLALSAGPQLDLISLWSPHSAPGLAFAFAWKDFVVVRTEGGEGAQRVPMRVDMVRVRV